MNILDRQREVLKAIKQNSLIRIDRVANREHWEKQQKVLSSNTSSDQSVSDISRLNKFKLLKFLF